VHVPIAKHSSLLARFPKTAADDLRQLLARSMSIGHATV
jgi:hypothetical protein